MYRKYYIIFILLLSIVNSGNVLSFINEYENVIAAEKDIPINVLSFNV